MDIRDRKIPQHCTRGPARTPWRICRGTPAARTPAHGPTRTPFRQGSFHGWLCTAPPAPRGTSPRKRLGPRPAPVARTGAATTTTGARRRGATRATPAPRGSDRLRGLYHGLLQLRDLHEYAGLLHKLRGGRSGKLAVLGLVGVSWLVPDLVAKQWPPAPCR